MSGYIMSTTTAASTSAPNECDVEKTYFPHLFLAPAGIIITILAFLRRRRSFKKDVLGGRPGLVVPIDFLGMDNDRLAIMCVFGAATGSIVTLVVAGVKEGSALETAFLTIGTALEMAFLYYPYFGCLASYHRIIGALMGFPYAATYFAVSMTADLQKCKLGDMTWLGYLLAALKKLPNIFCHLFILGKFILVLYKEIREHGMFGVQLFNRKNGPSAHQAKLTRPWLTERVKDLFNPRPSYQYSRIVFYLRKMYNPEENFKFSTQTLSVVMICFIVLFNMSLGLLTFSSASLKELNDEAELLQKEPNTVVRVAGLKLIDIYRGFFGSLLAATIFAGIFCVLSLFRFMENHKNNMLRMFKGDKSFIPKNISASQFIVGKGLRCFSYQIGYFLWGYVLLLALLFVICFCMYSLSFKMVRDWVIGFLKGAGVFLGVAIFGCLSLLLSVTIFRDYSYSKRVIVINNRNVYLMFSYFWFFIGLPMGFFSALLRILNAMAVGALMLTRLDHSVMPDGLQWLDGGFNAYICHLHVQAAYRNPILRVFCQMLLEYTKNQERNEHVLGVNWVRKWTYSAQARAKWFLALTLARNPQLAMERKSDVQAPKPMQSLYARNNDVTIEIDQFVSDNTVLLRD